MATGHGRSLARLDGPVLRRGPSAILAHEFKAGECPLDEVLTKIERREIVAALTKACGKRTLAANLLGISRSRLYRRMEALGIDIHAFGPHELV